MGGEQRCHVRRELLKLFSPKVAPLKAPRLVVPESSFRFSVCVGSSPPALAPDRWKIASLPLPGGVGLWAGSKGAALGENF